MRHSVFRFPVKVSHPSINPDEELKMHRRIRGKEEQRTKRDTSVLQWRMDEGKQVTTNKRIIQQQQRQQQNGARQCSAQGVGLDARDNGHCSETNAVATSQNMTKRESKSVVFGTKGTSFPSIYRPFIILSWEKTWP